MGLDIPDISAGIAVIGYLVPVLRLSSRRRVLPDPGSNQIDHLDLQPMKVSRSDPRRCHEQQMQLCHSAYCKRLCFLAFLRLSVVCLPGKQGAHDVLLDARRATRQRFRGAACTERESEINLSPQAYRRVPDTFVRSLPVALRDKHDHAVGTFEGLAAIK